MYPAFENPFKTARVAHTAPRLAPFLIMPLRSLGFILVSLFAGSFVHAQNIPTLVTPLPSKLDIGPAGLSLDLREYFVVPGIVGTQIVQFDTALGKFNVELRTDAAPRHVANFM